MRQFFEGTGKLLFTASLFLSFLGVIQLLYILVPSAVWSFVAFGIYGLFICALAVFTPVSFILLLPYIFFRATVLLSGIAIEHGGYISDLEILGEATGAYIRLTAIYVLFISFAAMIIEAGYKRLMTRGFDLESVRYRTNHHPWVWIFYSLFVAFSLYVLAVGMAKGFPLLDNIDRLTYRDEVGGRLFLLYMGNRMLAAYLFGIIFVLCSGLKKYLSAVFFILMVMISVLFGEKFTSLILIAIYAVTPAYLMNKELQKKIMGHLLPAMTAVALLTIPVILMVYGWSDNSEEAMDKLLTRMVGQGELWFVADRDTISAFRWDTDAIAHILKSTVSPHADDMVTLYPYSGAMYFMHQYMPPDMLALFLSKPSLTLTFGFEPYLLVVFGWIGMVFPLLFYVGVYALALLYLGWAVQKARPISIFLAGKILIWMVVGLAQGYLFLIFGFKVLFLVAFALFYEIISSFLSRPRYGTFTSGSSP